MKQEPSCKGGRLIAWVGLQTRKNKPSIGLAWDSVKYDPGRKVWITDPWAQGPRQHKITGQWFIKTCKDIMIMTLHLHTDTPTTVCQPNGMHHSTMLIAVLLKAIMVQTLWTFMKVFTISLLQGQFPTTHSLKVYYCSSIDLIVSL